VEPIPITLSTEEHDELRRLEKSLWRAETRFERDHMNEVLAPDFFEFGRSGRVYRREEILDVPAQPINVTLQLAKFAVRLIATDVALVTYVSGVIYGEVTEVANRSSLWSRHALGWRIRFHQGTPA
jgi:hypothetical protein